MDDPDATTPTPPVPTGANLWVCVFEPFPGVVVPEGRRMARLLKILGRQYGLECRFCGDRVPLPPTIARKKTRPRAKGGNPAPISTAVKQEPVGTAARLWSDPDAIGPDDAAAKP